jgi:hypothetical protein
MRQLIVKQLDYDLTPVAGLALVGHHLERLAPVFKRLDHRSSALWSCFRRFRAVTSFQIDELQAF